MDNYEEPSLLCEVCKEPVRGADHNASVNHRFHFMKWSYNEFRKALIKDRHGVVVEVKEEVRNDFHFDFTDFKNRGKYLVKVTPEQLLLHDKTLTLNCKIKNTRRDPVYVTSINLLHSSAYFSINHTNNFVLQLQPGKYYKFQVIFNTQILTAASYKIPLSCDFQTIDNKENFTIVRTFLVIIDDESKERGQKKKSPFTSKPWSDVKTTVPTTKELNYIDQYPIPGQYMKLLKYGLKRFDNMTGTEEHILRELNEMVEQLTRDSYNKFWHILLWMEERAQTLMLMKYNMEEVTIELFNDNVLILEVPGLAEKRPSVIVGDFIRIRVSGDHTAYKGFINKVNDGTVEILHVHDELLDCIRNDPSIKLDVSFTLSRLAFERMHHAVDRVVATGMVKNLFPTLQVSRDNVIYNLFDSDFYNQAIIHNSEQKTAVMKILNCVQPVPYIVFGPPGTGKTITIVEAILQLKKYTKKRILVCAPANSACDYIALKLIPHCNPDELIRIHSGTRDRSTITEELKEYSNMEDDEFTKVELSKICSCRIVVTTLTLIGKFARYSPDCIFVDEAAQASEPETDIAIALLTSGKQVVLAGDPKQLGPMVTDCAGKLGLGVSLLERLMQYQIYQPNANRTYNSSCITMLKLNFRSHPDILLIPNQLFYDNSLEARSGAARQDPIVKIPIYLQVRKNSVRFRNQKKQNSERKIGRAVEFYSLSSKEKREGSSPSYFNIMESKMVVQYVKALMDLNLGRDYAVTLDQIGVVTPYKRQVFKIKEGLRFNGYEGVEVGTTESFQGREKRIIIISTVRAQHALLLHDRKYSLGFVKHDQRFNVAITRAISKLVVIGCPLVLNTDNKWEMYMQLCKDYDTYFGNELPSADDAFKDEVIRRMQHFQKQDDQYNH